MVQAAQYYSILDIKSYSALSISRLLLLVAQTTGELLQFPNVGILLFISA